MNSLQFHADHPPKSKHKPTLHSALQLICQENTDNLLEKNCTNTSPTVCSALLCRPSTKKHTLHSAGQTPAKRTAQIHLQHHCVACTPYVKQTEQAHSPQYGADHLVTRIEQDIPNSALQMALKIAQPHGQQCSAEHEELRPGGGVIRVPFPDPPQPWVAPIVMMVVVSLHTTGKGAALRLFMFKKTRSTMKASFHEALIFKACLLGSLTNLPSLYAHPGNRYSKAEDMWCC